jgi:hypothetical protein
VNIATANGDVTATNPANDFQGTLNVNSGSGNVNVVEANNLTLGNVTSTGTVTATAAQNLNVGVISGSNVTTPSLISTGNTVALSSTAGAVSLGQIAASDVNITAATGITGTLTNSITATTALVLAGGTGTVGTQSQALNVTTPTVTASATGLSGPVQVSLAGSVGDFTIHRAAGYKPTGQMLLNGVDILTSGPQVPGAPTGGYVGTVNGTQVVAQFSPSMTGNNSVHLTDIGSPNAQLASNTYSPIVTMLNGRDINPVPSMVSIVGGGLGGGFGAGIGSGAGAAGGLGGAPTDQNRNRR